MTDESRPHGEAGSPDGADERMAELLAADPRPSTERRRELRSEGTEQSDDLLQRLEALDFVDNLVGEHSPEIPEQLGDYRIVGVLGRGGMGAVYDAWQESLARSVALKVLPPHLSADQRMRRRFQTEARAAATLNHQHIVPVYGYGKAAGLLYFAMEKVDGVSLDKRISHARNTDKQTMTPRDAARRFAGLADALAHAHRRGILHRDVKPGNILVHPDGTLALADFGLSKFIDEHSRSMSRDGGFLGTLHYAAPEQAKGRPASPASDLYALGVTLFETITGRLPLEGETTEALLDAVINGRPTTLRKVLPKAPRDLEVVLSKLLSKEPDERYTDGETLARDLLRVADDEPVKIRRQPLLVLAYRRLRKHKLISAVIAVAAVLLLTTLVMWRQILAEEEQSRQTRFDSLLSAAVGHAEIEAGPAAGPEQILEALCGIPTVPSQDDRAVWTLLEDAERELPGDPRVTELRAAYGGDPVPEATALLGAGRGRQASRAIRVQIDELERGSDFASRDAATWLRLYRLYMLRAVAAMTASLADADEAREDVIRASIIRPGAFAPKVLDALLSWRPRWGAKYLIETFEVLAQTAPDGGREVMAGLMRAVAGLDRPVTAHLMPYRLSYADRRELHEASLRWLPLTLGGGTHWSGQVEVELAGIARRAAEAFNDAGRRSTAVAAGERLLDSAITTRSPLRSWWIVYGMLDDPRAQVPAPSWGGAFAPEIQFRAFDALLDLDLQRPVLLSMERPVIEAFGAAEAVDPYLARRVRARLALRLDGSRLGARASEAIVQSWVELAIDDPDALFARFVLRVRHGTPEQASFDAARALQLTVDPEGLREKLISELRRAEARNDGQRSEWQHLRRLLSGEEG